MMLGARTASWAKSGYTAKDYAQDGLIWQLDSVENGGYGISNQVIRERWKDLVGSNDAILNVESLDASNGYVVIPQTVKPCVFNKFLPRHIECVFKYVSKASIPIIQFTDNNGVDSSDINEKRCRWVGIRSNGTVNFGQGGNYFYLNQNEVASISAYYLSDNINEVGDVFAYMNGVEVHTVSSGMNNKNLQGACFNPFSTYGITSSDWWSIRCYNRVLTQAEIAANYAIDKARFNLP